MRGKKQSRSLSHRWTDSLDCWGLHLWRKEEGKWITWYFDPRIMGLTLHKYIINTWARFPDRLNFPSFCHSEIWVTRNFRCIYHSAISGVWKKHHMPFSLKELVYIVKKVVPGSNLACSLLTGLLSPRRRICLWRASRRKTVSRQVKASPESDHWGDKCKASIVGYG